MGKETFLNGPLTSLPTLGDKHASYGIAFEWDPRHKGIPGAFFIQNYTQDEIFLVSLTLEDVATHEITNFVCNSWIYNAEKYQTERIFFANKVRIYKLHPTCSLLNIFFERQMLTFSYQIFLFSENLTTTNG